MKSTLVLVLSLSAALGFYVRGADSRAQQTSVAPAKAAPRTTNVEKLKVTEIKEEGLKSLIEASAGRGRPLLVNFWATWCIPCREEFPDLVKIRERYPDSALEFVTISLDEPSEIATTVPDFLMEMRAGRMPAYLLNAESQDAAVMMIHKEWRGELPATFLYDNQGELVFKHMGRVKPTELLPAIESIVPTNGR